MSPQFNLRSGILRKIRDMANYFSAETFIYGAVAEWLRRLTRILDINFPLGAQVQVLLVSDPHF